MTASRPFAAAIFDLDGTIFRGDAAIPGAAQAINRLRLDVPCRFLSNNGERRSKTLVDRVRNLGFDVENGEIISSADLVLGYLGREGKSHRILALTSDDLARGLEHQGHKIVDDDSADVIVVGVDRALTRERMVRGLHAALNGAMLIGTNEDPTYPGKDGLRPAAGAYVGFFRGMGIEPVCLCGKPDAWAIRQALSQWALDDPTACILVGDNLKTDIAGAPAIGAASALVLTGVSQRDDLFASPHKPTAVLESVAEIDLAKLTEISELQRAKNRLAGSNLAPGCGGSGVRGRTDCGGYHHDTRCLRPDPDHPCSRA